MVSNCSIIRNILSFSLMPGVDGSGRGPAAVRDPVRPETVEEVDCIVMVPVVFHLSR